MNYFERLWRRALLEAAGEARLDVDDPFAWVAPLLLEELRASEDSASVLPAPPTNPLPSSTTVAGDAAPGIAQTAAAPQPAPLAPLIPPSAAALSPPLESADPPERAIASATSVRDTLRVETVTRLPPGPPVSLARADAFMARLAPVAAAAARTSVPPAPSPTSVALSPPETPAAVVPAVPRAIALAPIGEAPPVVSASPGGPAQLTIGSIDVEVRAPQPARLAAPRVVIVRSPALPEATRGARGPMSQRFGIGQT